VSCHCFIFARGGSKGLPGKNIMEMNGKPLILYSIELAKKIDHFPHVFVSTDNKEIASISESAGAIVIERPNELATDNSPEWASWQHAVRWVIDKYGFFDDFVSLPTTSPLRIISDVTSAISQLKETKADICISVTPAKHNPFFNMVEINSNRRVKLLNQTIKNISRRQDAPIAYDISTVVYVSSAHYILNNTGIFDGNVTHIMIPKQRAIDIDDIYDFKFAEFIISNNGIADVKK